MNAVVWILILFLADGSAHASAKPRTLLGCGLAAKAATLQPGDQAICFNLDTKRNVYVLKGE